MAQINLLPWREQARQLSKMRFMVTTGMVAALAFILIVFIHLYVSGLFSYQERRVTYLQAELDKEQRHLTALIQQKKEQAVVDDELNFIFSLREKSYRSVQLLDVLTKVTPKDVSFNKITREGHNVTIEGRAKSNLEVTSLMKNMTAEKIFRQPDLNQITNKDGASGDERIFILKVEQKE